MSIYLETLCWKEFLPKVNGEGEGGGGGIRMSLLEKF